MTISVYVQSRGVSQDNDYRWLKIRENRPIPEIPPILRREITVTPKIQVRVPDLIDSQTHSIVLARSDGELLLLVTGLEAREERTDFMSRRVRNSVAWVCQNTEENERVIRSLAVRALRGELESEVDKAVSIGGEYGFEVKLEQLNQLVQLEKIGTLEAETPNFRIGENSPEFKEALALEIEQHCLLRKKRERLLVVVTGIKTKEALLKARVWRGLSSRVQTQKWIEIADKTINLTSNTLDLKQNQLKKKIPFWTIAFAAIALILIILLAIKLLTPPKLKPQAEVWHPLMILQTQESPQWLNQKSFSTSTTYSIPLERESTSTK